MEVYVIRHGQSESNKLGLHCGWADVSLTTLGHEQAKKSSRLISHIQFDIVYVSDLIRAKQTAVEVVPGYEYHFTDKLREINVGKLSLQSSAACLEKHGELYRTAKNKHDFRMFGGESPEEMQDRINSFLLELEKFNHNNVAIVAHEGTAHCILSYVFGYDIPRKSIKLDNAAVSKFSYKDGIWQLNTWNYTETV